MTIGRLRCRYSVRERTQQRDARGERLSSELAYKEKFEVWGEALREGSSSTSSEVGAVRSESSYRLRVRWREGFAVGDQLVDKASGAIFYLMTPPTDAPGAFRQYLQLVVTQSPGGVV